MDRKKQKKSILEPGDITVQYIEDAAPMTCPPGMVWCPTAQMCVVNTSSSCGGGETTPPPSGGGTPVPNPPSDYTGVSWQFQPCNRYIGDTTPICPTPKPSPYTMNDSCNIKCITWSDQWKVINCATVAAPAQKGSYTWTTVGPTGSVPATTNSGIHIGRLQNIANTKLPHEAIANTRTPSIPRHNLSDVTCDCKMQSEPSETHCYFDDKEEDAA